MVRKLGISFVLLSLFAFGIRAPAFAQTTGSIRGVVSDATGAVLPGATVTITSDALIGATRTTVTNELGVYRFPALPVGLYTVEVTMDGFVTYRTDDVQVSLNQTASVNATLEVATLAEAVTVRGESPVVDVTRSAVSTSYRTEMLEEIPTQRNMYDLIQVSPGMSVDFGDGQSDRVVAFGSNRQSNSWNIDGVDVSAPETGSAWWTVNMDNIEEIQVLGVGAPAEYGNHLGGVFNVVTKKGGNDFRGSANYFFQHQRLTDVNVRLPDSPFAFNRDLFRNVTSQLGGPIVRDRTWFFGSFEHWREASTEPGNDPATAPTNYSDKYDLKVTSRLTDRHELNGFVHHDDWGYSDAPSPFWTASALSGERGRNPAWGGGVNSVMSDKLLLEFRYAGWWSDDIHDSQTGSFEEPFIDYTPPDGGPTRYAGGVWWPWDYVTDRHQANAKATYYAHNFLSTEHEFRMGVQYSRGTAKTNVGPGPTGSYLYNYGGYLYRVFQDPYQYGGVTHDVGVFIDDTVTVSDRLTLNLGVRFDRNTGSIPDYERLTIGEPSISPAGQFTGTGEVVPGVRNLIRWRNASPRVGFAFRPAGDARSVVRGSFGVYYDQNVIGNWNVPAPEIPPWRLFFFDPDTGEHDLLFEFLADDVAFNPNLKAPRTLQYAIGYEQQLFTNVSAGVQYVRKDTRDLVGWEILDGAYEPFPFTDPISGASYTLLSQVEVPTLRKGNHPGNFPGAENLRYWQRYNGTVFTFSRRFVDRWGLNASYTWSRSEGLIPRMLSQVQFNPFYGSKEGADPNHYINAEGRLQGDRPHMFRVQGLLRLPYDFQFSTSLEMSSGRAHSRQIRVGGLGQGTTSVIMEPLGAYRYSPIRNVDLLVGKRVRLNNRAVLRFEGWVFNALNSDQELFFADLRLQTAADRFTPDTWMKPRRLQLRVGLQF